MTEERYSRMHPLVGSMVQASPKPLPAQFTGKRQLLEALLLDAIWRWQTEVQHASREKGGEALPHLSLPAAHH